MINTNAAWMNTLAKNISSMDFAIATCIVGIIFFMKYDTKASKNTGHKYIAISLGVGFIMLVGFRIYKGL